MGLVERGPLDQDTGNLIWQMILEAQDHPDGSIEGIVALLDAHPEFEDMVLSIIDVASSLNQELRAGDL